MWSKVRNGFVAGTIGLTLITGCGIDRSEENTSSTSHSELVTKYNELLTSSHRVQVRAEQESKELQELDDSLNEFAVEAKKIRTSIKTYQLTQEDLQDELKELDSLLGQINNRISKLEQTIASELSALHTNAGKVYENKFLNQANLEIEQNRMNQKSRVLRGLHALVNQEQTAVYAEVLALPRF